MNKLWKWFKSFFIKEKNKMATTRKDVHVSYKDKKWCVRQAKEVKSTHKTKKPAEAAGKKLAKKLKTELVIHGKDGKIQNKYSYGNDPRSIKG